MNKEELQIENGNFTRIVNPLIDELIKVPFKGCELAVALFIIRKTYGFQKKQDEISLTQLEIGLDRSRQTIVTALKNLQLVNILRLVKRGSSRTSANVWEINKYYDTWKLVNMARLVKRKRGTSLTEANKLVKTARHTKENNKRNTKEIISKDIKQGYGNEKINEIFNYFENKLGGSLDGTIKENRYSAYRLLNRMKKDYPTFDEALSVKRLIDASRQSEFHSKNATSFIYLEKHSQKIIQELKTNTTSLKGKIVSL